MDAGRGAAAGGAGDAQRRRGRARDLPERLRRTIERTLAACEQERWTPVQPLRAVSEHGDAVPSTTGEFRTIGEFRDTRTFRTTGEHQGTDVARVAP
jgi:hypothetical protein